MRTYARVLPLVFGLALAAGLSATALLGPGLALAGDNEPSVTSPCTCPDDRKLDRQKLWPRPKLADLRPVLDDRDELATLEALQVALSEVGDGSSYVWHRPGGMISGVIQPTSSFKDTGGKICRHIELVLTAGAHSRKMEGIACRLPTGKWQLDG